jgi:phospholipid/cholesterol/gamma-HCH transport system permease protein
MSVHVKLSDKTVIEEKKLSESTFLNALKDFFEEVTALTKFVFVFFKTAVKPPYELNEIVKQSYIIGYKSFPLVAITGFIMGLVLTIQSRPTLAEFGAESWLPAMVAVSIIREIGPVITALIFAGKAGSGIGAELSSMKVTEQIEAMEVSGINPIKYLVVTRVVSATIMLPLLVILSDAVSLYGAYIGVNLKGDVSFHLFFSQVFEKITFTDVFPAFIKTIFFGFTVGLIACYKGYNSSNGTEGVGKAANSAVVLGSLSIFILDMIAVQITSLIN